MSALRPLRISDAGEAGEMQARMVDSAYDMYREYANHCDSIRRSIMGIFIAAEGGAGYFFNLQTTNMMTIENKIFIPGLCMFVAWACMWAERHYCREIVKAVNRGIAAEEVIRPKIRFYDMMSADFATWALTMTEAAYVSVAVLWFFIGISMYGM